MNDILIHNNSIVKQIINMSTTCEYYSSKHVDHFSEFEQIMTKQPMFQIPINVFYETVTVLFNFFIIEYTCINDTIIVLILKCRQKCHQCRN